MKIIEGLKQIKDLQRKASNLRELIKHSCAKSSFESDKYPEQAKKVAGWLQAHFDLTKEILRLRIAIQRTNLATNVTIELFGKSVEKTIAEWIHRRRDLAALDLESWRCLTDRGIKEGKAVAASGDPMDVKIVRYYDPDERDRMVDRFQSEPSIIDSRLEVVNAITDLIE